MPRNPSGTYTLPIAAFAAGGVIRASDHNSNYSDIATALTQSLATTGVSSMTGPIKAAAGSVSAPSITFASGTTTGFYLAGANQIGWAAAGALSATFNADGTVDFVNPITIDGAVPISLDPGTAMVFHQTAAPTFWTKVTSAAYNDGALRVVTGTASTGGTAAFSATFTARTILEANLPAHSHSVTDPGHAHTYNNIGTTVKDGAFNSAATLEAGTNNTGNATTGITIGNTGSGTAMDFAVKYVDVIVATKD